MNSDKEYNTGDLVHEHYCHKNFDNYFVILGKKNVGGMYAYETYSLTFNTHETLWDVSQSNLIHWTRVA